MIQISHGGGWFTTYLHFQSRSVHEGQKVNQGGYLDSAATRLMSAASHVELGIVIEARLGPAGADAISRFLRDADIEIVDVDTDAANRALSAWRRYGKGRHRAALNFGDCFAYALAERTGLPLLCTDDDFLEVIRPTSQPGSPG